MIIKDIWNVKIFFSLSWEDKEKEGKKQSYKTLLILTNKDHNQKQASLLH